MSFLGGGKKVDTSAYDKQIADANARAEEAKKAAEKAAEDARLQEEEAKRQQKDLQDGILEGNKAKRASAANRFSLLLFEDDTLGA